MPNEILPNPNKQANHFTDVIAFPEIIERAKNLGVDFGKGDPFNRLRYYTKIGLLPKAVRKSFGQGNTQGAYRANVVETLVEIDRKLKSGLSIQSIIREEKNDFIPFEKVISRAKSSGVDLGKGDPFNRLRYYTKIGLLPNATRKAFAGNLPTGAYPESVVNTLIQIDKEFKTGKSIQTILREKKTLEKETNTNLIPTLSEPIEETANQFVPPVTLIPVFKTAPPRPNLINLPQEENFEPTKQEDSTEAVKKVSFPKLGKWSLFAGFAIIFLLSGLTFLVLNQSFFKQKPPVTTTFQPESFASSGLVLGTNISPYLNVNVETDINSLLHTKSGIRTENSNINLGSGKVIFENNGKTGTLTSATLTGNQTYSLPNQSGTLCIFGSCGGSTGILISTSTVGRLAKFTSSGAIGDSLLSESGNSVSVSGDFSATGFITIGNLATSTATSVCLNGNILAACTSGLGDITAVGDVTAGDAFTFSGTNGTELYFHNSGFNGLISSNFADTGINYTTSHIYSLPNQTGIFTLTQSDLTPGSILFADANGLIGQDNANFFYNSTTKRVGIGTNLPAGTIDVKTTQATGNIFSLSNPTAATALTANLTGINLDLGTNYTNAGSFNRFGVNIANITTGQLNDTALNIGNGWNSAILINKDTNPTAITNLSTPIIGISGTYTKDVTDSSLYAIDLSSIVKVNTTPCLFCTDIFLNGHPTYQINGTGVDLSGTVTVFSAPSINVIGNNTGVHSIPTVINFSSANDFHVTDFTNDSLNVTDLTGYLVRGNFSFFNQGIGSKVTITNSYGLHVEDNIPITDPGASSPGVVTNQYGVAVDNLTGGGKNYGVYLSGAKDADLLALAGNSNLASNSVVRLENLTSNFTGKYLDIQTQTSFSKVLYHNGTSFSDNTGESATTGGTPFTLLDPALPSSKTYLINDTSFSTVYFNLAVAASSSSLAWEYCTANSNTNTPCDTWSTLTLSTDTTNGFTVAGAGTITFTAPLNWVQSREQITTGYTIRVGASSLSGTPTANYALLAVSTSGSAINVTGGGISTFTLNYQGASTFQPSVANINPITANLPSINSGTVSGLLINGVTTTGGVEYGVNISAITNGAGTETALNVGSGWDAILTAGALANTSSASATAISATNGSTTTSGTQTTFSSTLGIANASTTQNGLLVTPSSSTSSGNVYGINVGALGTAGGGSSNEVGVLVGSGWDYGIWSVSKARFDNNIELTGSLAAPDLSTEVVCRNYTTTNLLAACSASGGIVGNAFVHLAPQDPLAPGSPLADVDNTTRKSIFINKTGASGDLINMQVNGTDKFKVDYSGNITNSGTILTTGSITSNTSLITGNLSIAGNTIQELNCAPFCANIRINTEIYLNAPSWITLSTPDFIQLDTGNIHFDNIVNFSFDSGISPQRLTIGPSVLTTLSGSLVVNGTGTISTTASITSGTDLIATGVVNLSGSGATSTVLTSGASGGQKTITFPNLTGTVALLEGTQTFTGAKTFNDLTIADTNVPFSGGSTTLDVQGGSTTTLTLLNSTASQVANLDLNDGDLSFGGATRITNAGAATFTTGTLTATTNQIVLGTTNTVTISSLAPAASRTATIPVLGSNDSFCFVTLGNCAGSGTGVTSALGGTARKLAVFTSSQNIENSILEELSGNLNLTSGTFQTNGTTRLTNAGALQNISSLGLLNSTFTATVQPATLTGSATYTIPDTAGVNDNFCLLTKANCVGTGGGVSSLGGTTGRIAKFTDSTAIGDSLFNETGGNIDLTSGNLLLSGTTRITSAGAATFVTVNALTLTSQADGFTVAGGTTSRTLTVTGQDITIGSTIKPTSNSNTLDINTTSANLTLATVTSGTLALTSAGALNFTGAAASTWGFGTSTIGLTSGLITATSQVNINKVNTAGSGLDVLTLSGTLAAFDGSDTFRGLYLNYTNANHTSTSNVFNGLDIAGIVGDVDATETAINLGPGWENILKSSASSAFTQVEALTGINFDFSTNYTVPNSALGNQTGIYLTFKDSGSISKGISIAGTVDTGIQVEGTDGNTIGAGYVVGTRSAAGVSVTQGFVYNLQGVCVFTCSTASTGLDAFLTNLVCSSCNIASSVTVTNAFHLKANGAETTVTNGFYAEINNNAFLTNGFRLSGTGNITNGVLVDPNGTITNAFRTTAAGITITNGFFAESTSNGLFTNGVHVTANGSGTITNGLLVDSTNSGVTTNAVNASDANIVNALSIGANSIIGTDFNVNTLSTSFGALAETGGFASLNAYFGEEFARERADTAPGTAAALNWGDATELGTTTTGNNNCVVSILDNTLNGITRLGTGNGASNGSNCSLYNSSPTAGTAQTIFASGNRPVIYIKAKPASITTPTARVFILGISDAVTGSMTSPTNGIYFTNLDDAGTPAGSSNWYGKVRSAGTESSTSSCGAINTATGKYALLKIVVVSTSSVQFWIDTDVSDGVAFSLCGTLTTNIPTGNLNLYLSAAANTSTALNLDLDFVRIWQDDNTVPQEIAAPVSAPIETGDLNNDNNLVTNESFDLVTKADIAENYSSDPSQNLGPGDLVSLNSSGNLVKSSLAYDQKLLGIISTNPNQVLGTNQNANSQKVALVGRVPTKVSSENGPITPGDPLTSSSLPGIAMKATQTGPIVGRALENYANGDKTVVGSILVNVTPGWFALSLNEAASPTLFSELAIKTLSAETILLGDKISLTKDGKLTLNGQLLVTGSINLNGDLTIIGKVNTETVIASEFQVKTKDNDQNQTAGESTLISGQTEVVINSAKVKTDSLIFVTATTLTDKALVVTEKVAGESFKVSIKGAETTDIKFSWIIINQVKD